MTLGWTDLTNGRGDLLLPIERLLVPRSHSKGAVPDVFEMARRDSPCSAERETLYGSSFTTWTSFLVMVVAPRLSHPMKTVAWLYDEVVQPGERSSEVLFNPES
jgi:hypothetical protein